jgi:hypothetical protein
MDILLFAFAVLSYSEMREGVLRAWWNVVAAGFLLTLVGTAALLFFRSRALLGAVVVGWMLLPVAGFLPTAKRSAPRVYGGAAALSALGAVCYLLGVWVPPAALAGFALVGVGQTAAIVHAVVRY